MAKREQVSVSFSDKEREVIEEIANGLGRSVSSVVRDATVRGLPAVMKDYRALKEAMKGGEDSVK